MLDPAFDRVLHRDIPIPRDAPGNKVMPLAVAVERCVRPGMTLHFSTLPARPVAAAYEVIRRFYGREPGFTMVAIGTSGPYLLPIAAGIVRKVVTSFAGDTYPTPGPNRVYRETYADGSVAYEMWSILSLTLRLKAAALGVPYLPTRSLVGSTMAEENAHALRIEETPDGPFALVSALAPDVSFVHAWASDPAGNAILPEPLGEHVYGALAAREGIVLTAEHIVSTETVRRHAGRVRIPGSHVRAVCHAPFGAHPTGMNAHAFPGAGWTPYVDDYPFLEDIRRAAKDPADLEAFIREWILDTHDWEDVVHRLGGERRARLARLAEPDGWEVELDELAGRLDGDAPPTGIERMVCAAAGRIQSRVRAEGYDALLAGVGASNLAAWLAHTGLRRSGAPTVLMAELGFVGYDPRPADPFIFNLRNVPTCTLQADVETVMGVLMSGAQGRCLGVLGAGQIDRYGNINSTRLGADRFLVGSGGANDVCSGAREVLVCALQSPQRFVERVDYVTGPGARVRTLVTPDAIYEKLDGAATFTLTGVLGGGDVEAAVRAATARCGWDVPVADRPEAIPEPDPDAVRLLRLFDPRRQFLGKLDAAA